MGLVFCRAQNDGKPVPATPACVERTSKYSLRVFLNSSAGKEFEAHAFALGPIGTAASDSWSRRELCLISRWYDRADQSIFHAVYLLYGSHSLSEKKIRKHGSSDKIRPPSVEMHSHMA